MTVACWLVVWLVMWAAAFFVVDGELDRATDVSHWDQYDDEVDP